MQDFARRGALGAPSSRRESNLTKFEAAEKRAEVAGARAFWRRALSRYEDAMAAMAKAKAELDRYEIEIPQGRGVRPKQRDWSGFPYPDYGDVNEYLPPESIKRPLSKV